MRIHSYMLEWLEKLANQGGVLSPKHLAEMLLMTPWSNVTSAVTTIFEEEGDVSREKQIHILTSMMMAGWLKNGRRTIVLTQKTYDQLDAMKDTKVLIDTRTNKILAFPFLDAIEGREGDAFEVLFPDGIGCVFWCQPHGWGEHVRLGSEFGTSKWAAVLNASSEFMHDFQRRQEVESRHLFVAAKAIEAYLNPEIGIVRKTSRAVLSREGKRQVKSQRGLTRVQMETLILIPERTATLRLVTVSSPAEGSTTERTPPRAHTVKAHTTVKWVLCPRPGEQVIGKKVSRTVLLNGEEHHTYLYAVKRERKGHKRGKGEVDYRPRLSLIQGGD